MNYFKGLQKSHKWFAVGLLDAIDHSKCVKESQFLRKKYTLGAGFCGFL